MNADGSNQRRLTSDSGTENFYASISPDGNSVVYSSNSTGNFEIYEADFFGRQTRLTFKIGDLYAPEISPDGQFIVFTNGINGHQGIWVMNRNSSAAYEIFGPSKGGDGWDPVWSPDGTRILFASDHAGGVQLFTINPNGSGLTQVTNMKGLRGRSDWSILGQISTYSGDSWLREIYIIDSDEGNPGKLTKGGNNLAPSFSPDGMWIAFTSYLNSYKSSDGCQIYIMRKDGSDLRQLTDTTYCNYQPRWGP
jgi:TolB protein